MHQTTTHKPKILIGLPTMGNIHVMLAVRIMAWLSQAQQKGNINMSVYPTMNISPVDQARNNIVEEFLVGDCSHLLFVDADTIPPQNAIEKMLAADKDIISAITPIVEYDDKRKDSDSNGYYKKWNCVNEGDVFVHPNTGILPIKGAGSSCILIKRAVFEKMEKPWYRFLYKSDEGRDIVVGEDIHFMLKAIAAGFKPFCDTSIICTHFKQIGW